MTWVEIGTGNLAAAKLLVTGQPRSAVSRAYYAAHVVLAHALIKNGYVPPAPRQTQPHGLQAKLIGLHLGSLGTGGVSRVRQVMRRLYGRRIDADYKRTVTTGRASALEAVRDATTLFLVLGVR